MSYKEYFSRELNGDETYIFFERELPENEANYSDKEIRYHLETLPLNKRSAITKNNEQKT